MNESISPDTFKHLVELAALELDEAEAQYLLTQMNNQLKAIHELEQIPLDEKIPPARHGVPFPAEISLPPREDKVEVFPHVDHIIAQVPTAEDRYIIVPDIPHTELE